MRSSGNLSGTPELEDGEGEGWLNKVGFKWVRKSDYGREE
jgi:hypothetical protein